MNICVIGSGYVGLVTAACFADMGNQVWCMDNDAEKINRLRQGEIPIYEPGLQELVENNLKDGRLSFTTSLKEGLEYCQLCFIAVGTPPREDGSADVFYVLNVARLIGELMEQDMIIVNKSTVPAGTAVQVRETIQIQLQLRSKEDLQFEVVSNPEFLKQGAAVEDFMRPDRIILGVDNAGAAEVMTRLYEPFTRNNHPIIIMNVKSAEITKYAANAMLAARISFMNELAILCDAIGADIAQVRRGIGSDHRIGMDFLYAGIGYGGSCFPKDVKELIHTGQVNGVHMDIMSTVDKVNHRQKYYLLEMITDRLGEDLQGKTLAVWGLAFKPLTDDMREAPSITIINDLLKRGAKIRAYDPAAMDKARNIWGLDHPGIDFVDNMLEAISGADALLLITEWRQFRQVDFKEINALMKTALVFDGRNQYEPLQIKDMGIEYYCIGRNCHVR